MFDPLCFRCDECNGTGNSLTSDNRIICVNCKKDWVPDSAPMDSNRAKALASIENSIARARRLAEFEARVQINNALMRMDHKFGGMIPRSEFLNALSEALSNR